MTLKDMRRRSLWLGEALRDDDNKAPPLGGEARADVCIVGGGFTGLWTAIRLKEAQPSLDVAIIEKDFCGAGASGRNGGFVLSWWAKFLSLKKICGEEEAVRLAKASADNVTELGKFCAANGIDSHYRKDGWLWAATSAAQIGAWQGTMDAAECVRQYKSLAQVERAFRTLKSVDLRIRPIHHRLADRVRAHILLCVLAYYIEWHMREAWRELMFADEDQAAKATRDPVAPAKRSETARIKAQSGKLADGTPAHSFSTLLAELSAIVRNTCRAALPGESTSTFEVMTSANTKQQRALDLLQKIAL